MSLRGSWEPAGKYEEENKNHLGVFHPRHCLLGFRFRPASTPHGLLSALCPWFLSPPCCPLSCTPRGDELCPRPLPWPPRTLRRPHPTLTRAPDGLARTERIHPRMVRLCLPGLLMRLPVPCCQLVQSTSRAGPGPGCSMLLVLLSATRFPNKGAASLSF